MPGQFVLKEFLCQAPNDLICEYLKTRGIGDDINWKLLPETEVDVIHRAINSADEQVVEEVNSDFSEIHDMSDSSGIVTLIEVGQDFEPSVELVEELAGVPSNYRKAFLVFLRHPDVFRLAHRVDDFNTSHSFGLTDMPELPDDWDPDVCSEQIRKSISEHYQHSEGRGDGCEVGYDEIGGKHYWFVYLENYTNVEPGFDDSHRLGLQIRRPVFSISCRYDEKDRTLDIAGVKRRDKTDEIKDFFTSAIFGMEFKDVGIKRKYQLKHLLDPDYAFEPQLELGVARCKLKNARLNAHGRTGLTMLIELGDGCGRGDLQECVRSFLRIANISVEDARVRSVKLQIAFVPEPGRRKGKTLTFSVTDTDSTDLKSDTKSNIARECLKRWGIDTNRAGGDRSSQPSHVGQTVIKRW